MRQSWLAVVLAVMVLGLTGCPGGGQDSSAPQDAGAAGTKKPGKTYKIAVIPKGTTHECWKSVHAGAANAAAELGNVELFWKGTILETDRAGQISVVQDISTKGVDGLVLAPLDSQSLIAQVQEAKDAGTPTVIFDSGLDK